MCIYIYGSISLHVPCLSKLYRFCWDFIVCFTSFSDEMIAPSVPRVLPLSPTEVQIDWEPITKGVAVDFYKIQYKIVGGRSGRDSPWRTIDGVIRDTVSYKVAQLEPGIHSTQIDFYKLLNRDM